jgi:hypothetical protein
LQATSPCIDAGSNAAVPAIITTDLNGKSRALDVPGVHDPGAIVDMGAYERGSDATVSGSAGADVFYARQSADGSALQVWAGAAPVGTPTTSFPTATLESCTFDTGGGDDSLTVDLSNGMPEDITFLAGLGNDKLAVPGLSASSIVNDQPNWFNFGPAAITSSGNEATLIDATASGATIGMLAANVADTLALATGRQLTFKPTQLNFAGTGKLDLTNNQAILNAAATVVQSELKNHQLVTSTVGGVLGYADLGNGQTEVRFTLGGDANLDQHVDVADLGALATNYGKTSGAMWSQGDFNSDGKVDVGDLGILATNYGQSGNAVWSEGDFTGDGTVDVGDLGVLATHYGQSPGGGAAAAAALATLVTATASTTTTAAATSATRTADSLTFGDLAIDSAAANDLYASIDPVLSNDAEVRRV